MDIKYFSDFVDIVNDRFEPDHEVIGVLIEYSSRKICFTDMLQRMKNLLIAHPDLLLALHKLIPAEKEEEHAKMSSDIEKMKSRKLKIEKASTFKRKLKSRLRGKERVLEAFNKAMIDFKKNFRTKGREKINKAVVVETDSKVRVILKKYPDLYIEFTTLIASSLEKKSTLMQSEQRRMEGKSRPTRERLYRPYEKKAFDMEDARSDYDVGVERMKSTAERVGRMMEGGYKEELSAVNMRCIKEMYGEYGADVLDIVRPQPEKALPVIFPRLLQKVKEMKNDRSAIDYGLKRALMRLGS